MANEFDRIMELDGRLETAFACNEADLQSHDFRESYRSPLFGFVREAKSIPQLRNLTAASALREVQNWLDRSDACWLDFDGIESEEDARVAFLDIWETVRFIPGEEPLDAALMDARREPLAVNTRPGSKGYPLFVSVAGHLEIRFGGEGRILLPCKELGKLLGCSKVTVATYRKWAVEDGYLDVLNKHTFDAKTGRGKATEFVFRLGRFPQLLKKAE